MFQCTFFYSFSMFFGEHLRGIDAKWTLKPGSAQHSLGKSRRCHCFGKLFAAVGILKLKSCQSSSETRFQLAAQ